jgi:hypothetical protein
MTPGEFLAKWTNEAEAMHRRGVMVNGRGLLAEVLADFRAVMASEAEAVLSLREAASRSGYSVEHLGRLIREGRVPNAGRKGTPRIRAADLPRKPRSLAPVGPQAYDPGADARNLLSRQRGGSNG